MVTLDSRAAHARWPVLNTGRRAGRRPIRPLLFAYGMLLPAVALVAIFIIYPFVNGISKAFFAYDGSSVDQFNGIDNFVAMAKDPLILPAFRNVLILLAAGTAQALVVPLLAAWLIHHLKSDRLRYLFRNAVMIPAVVPSVVLMLVWVQFLSNGGAVNRVLTAVGLHSATKDWFHDPMWVLVGLMIVNFPWLNGINTLLYLAALGEVPGELYESARLDGAGRWRIFRGIELPHVKSLSRILVLLSVLAGLQGYEGILIMTQGGPFDSSDVPGLLLYKNAFQFSQFGYASAIGLVMYLVTLILYGIFSLLTRSRND